jgi:small subunit ribosomal protein S16
MAVKIRMARVGKKNAPYFRIVAVDSRKKRDGACIEDLGTYNPITGKMIQFHKDRIDAWIAQGATPSDTVKRLYKLQKKSSQVGA